MAHIDYYFATVSPFTYLAGTRLEDIAAKHGATITYKPLDVIALFARTGGVAPKDRHPARMAYRMQELRRQSAKASMPINFQPAFWPTNPAPSSYVIIAAQKAGGGDLGKLVATITAKCWAEEKNIAEDDVIREALVEAGYDAGLADGMMMAEADEYAANLEEAVSRNVFGAPFYLVDGTEHFWGQDRLDDLDLFLAGKL